jgi:hypothetical protein
MGYKMVYRVRYGLQNDLQGTVWVTKWFTGYHMGKEGFTGYGMGYKMIYRVSNGLGRVYKCLLSYKRMTNPKVIKTPLIIPSSS